MKEKIANILKTVLVLFLAVLVIIMMLEIRKIQGSRQRSPCGAGGGKA